MGKVNQEERASRGWRVLAEVAAYETTITYGELAGKLGLHHRTARYFLELIQSFCLDAKLPPLTILVVGKSGVPGRGFIAWDVDNLEEGFAEVYQHNWSAVPNPFAYASAGATLEDLAAALENRRVRPSEVYALVRVRGVIQKLFRSTLLRVYRQRCSVCQFPVRDGLDSAHIKPWAECTPAERLDVTNGILLCRNHHVLFDSGTLHINEDFSYEFRGSHANWLKAAAVADGRLVLPREEVHRPGPRYLRARITGRGRKEVASL